MPEQPLDRLYQQIGYVPSEPDTFKHALIHRSVEGLNNERLEFLGDSVLGAIMSHELCLRFTHLPEGKLSRLRSRLVCGKSLATLAREFELSNYMVMGGGEKRSGGHRRDSVLEDALEAMIGAIYLDVGYDACYQIVLGWFASRLDNLTDADAERDPKSRLQEFLQARQETLPEYHLVSATGPDHAQTFEVRCDLPSRDLSANGIGESRKYAEQAAARVLLVKLKADKK